MRLHNIKAVANQLCVTDKTIRRWSKASGILPTQLRGGRATAMKWTDAQIEKLIKWRMNAT